MGIVGRLQAGSDASTAAALVKDVGTRVDRQIPDMVRFYAGDLSADAQRLLREGIVAAPGFTLRGGTTEVLRMIVARALAPS